MAKCRNCARFVRVNEDETILPGAPNWCFYLCANPSELGANVDIECHVFKSLTNADLIRAMTDEDLADFIARQRFSAVNPIADKLDIDLTTVFIAGRKNALDWLRQEATD